MENVDLPSSLLGALIAVSVVLLALVLVLLTVGRKLLSFGFGFRTFGVERVQGRVQLKGQFDDSALRPTQETAIAPMQIEQSFEGQDPERVAKIFQREVLERSKQDDAS